MKKNKYITPTTEVLEVSVEQAVMAMSSPDSGIQWGGNASDNEQAEPDAIGTDNWNIWK